MKHGRCLHGEGSGRVVNVADRLANRSRCCRAGDRSGRVRELRDRVAGDIARVLSAQVRIAGVRGRWIVGTSGHRSDGLEVTIVWPVEVPGSRHVDGENRLASHTLSTEAEDVVRVVGEGVTSLEPGVRQAVAKAMTMAATAEATTAGATATRVTAATVEVIADGTPNLSVTYSAGLTFVGSNVGG